jgi:hypothetical protein
MGSIDPIIARKNKGNCSTGSGWLYPLNLNNIINRFAPYF